MNRCFSNQIKQRRGGATLVELLVASALVLLVAISVLWLLKHGVRYVRESDERLEIQRNALFAVARLTQEIGESNPVSFRVDVSPPGVVFGSPRNAEGTLIVNNQGVMVWQKFICYYLDDINGVTRLIRKERMLDPVVRVAFPPAPGAGLSTADFQTLDVPAKVVAHGIEEFLVTPGTRVQINITAARRDYRNRLFQVKLETSATMKN